MRGLALKSAKKRRAKRKRTADAERERLDAAAKARDDIDLAQRRSARRQARGSS
jgi:hypothetical protein